MFDPHFAAVWNDLSMQNKRELCNHVFTLEKFAARSWKAIPELAKRSLFPILRWEKPQMTDVGKNIRNIREKHEDAKPYPAFTNQLEGDLDYLLQVAEAALKVVKQPPWSRAGSIDNLHQAIKNDKYGQN